MATLVIKVSTDKIGSECTIKVDIPDEEMEYLTDEDLDEIAMENMWNKVNMSYEVE